MALPPVKADLNNQVCVVTGANTGMGKVTAQALAKMGATVVLACRNADRAEAAKKDIVAATGNARVEVALVDVSSLASIRDFAAKLTSAHPRIDVLVNNAAAWWHDARQSVDGLELQWATNVVGPYLLTELLLPALKASGHGRIVNVASTAAAAVDLSDPEFKKRKYNGVTAYSASKGANRMLTWALARRLDGKTCVANALSPGLVSTELNRSAEGFFGFMFGVFKFFARTPEQGADTAIWLAASPDTAGVHAKFLVDRKEKACEYNVPDNVAKLEEIVRGQSGLSRLAAA